MDGAALILSLPDDVLALISAHLVPRDLWSLASTSRALLSLISTSDKAWLAQCVSLPGGPPSDQLPLWRPSFTSYAALCRFLCSAAPLLGLWVHQNPELGNVVFLLWGAASVVACRVVPQELDGPLLWSPVFELLPSPADGSPSLLFLHGCHHQFNGGDHHHTLSLGSVAAPIHPSANVLLLDAHVRPYDRPRSSVRPPRRSLRRFCRSDCDVNVSAPPPPATPFRKLAFSDRQRLLELVSSKTSVKLSTPLSPAIIFRGAVLNPEIWGQRTSALTELHKQHGGGGIDARAVEIQLSAMMRYKNLDADGSLQKGNGFSSVAGFVMDELKHLVWKSSSSHSSNGRRLKNRSGSEACGESKHVPVHEFLQAGSSIGLKLRAVNMKLSMYRGWPNMPDNLFALYKLPVQAPDVDREYAGLWVGSFGWPPGQTSEDKPGKALFLLMVSYEEVDGRLLLIATKILEGSHYVLHPNGSAMFVVKMDEPTSEPFPWEFDGYTRPVEVNHAYCGDGISSGYGFRYPGSKPGYLFVMQNGLVAFLWKESKAILTMQRMDLADNLKKGELVPALSPIANFAYLTKSYLNVFAGFNSILTCSSSSRSTAPIPEELLS